MKSHLLLQAITLVSCLVIIARAEPALNRMSRCTPILIRLSMHLLTIGSLAGVGCIVFRGEVPTWPTAIVLAGVATLLICERRLRVLCPSVRHRTTIDRGRSNG